jgi:hypothetical protein
MKRCTFCRKKAVIRTGTCLRCGLKNTPFDFFMDTYGAIIAAACVVVFLLVGVAMLAGGT